MEEEHKKMMQSLDLDHFSLSRVPRPDDESVERKRREKEEADKSEKRRREVDAIMKKKGSL